LEFLLQKRQFRGKMKNPDMGRRQQGQKRMKVILETGRNGISVGSKESREKLNQAGQNGGDPAKRGRPARAKKSKEQKTIEETITGVKGGKDIAKQATGNFNDSRAGSTRLAFDELSCTRCKLSPRNGDKGIKGLATKNISVEKHDWEEVESVISPRSEKFPNGRIVTEAVVLQPGDEIRLSNAMDFGLDEDATGCFRERFVKASPERPSDG
jgi:hypothetical protein